MAYIFHVYPYLMGTTGLQSTFHKRNISQLLKHRIMRNRRFPLTPVGKNGHLQTVFRVTTDIPLDTSGRFFHTPPDQCHILTLRSLLKKLFSEGGFGFGRFCYNQQARSIFVDTMHQSQPRIGYIEIGVISKSISQCIEQRPRIIPVSGVDDQSGRFIHDQHFAVFIYDIERNIFG